MGKRTSESKSHELERSDLGGHAGLDELRQQTNLWYRLLVLLYDLNNVANDPASEKRICSTTNELYISESYFTMAEASRIHSAMVGIIFDESIDAFDAAADTEVVIGRIDKLEADDLPILNDDVAAGRATDDRATAKAITAEEPTVEGVTVEDEIHCKLRNFFEKRRASGDARPCGAHDLLLIYLQVFNIHKD